MKMCGFNYSGLGILNSSRSFKLLLLFISLPPHPSVHSSTSCYLVEYYALMGGTKPRVTQFSPLCYLPASLEPLSSRGRAGLSHSQEHSFSWLVCIKTHLCFGSVFEDDFILCLWPVFLLNPDSFESCCFTMLFQV